MDTTRFVSGHGLIERPVDECVARLNGADVARRARLVVAAQPVSRQEVLDYLGLLTFPATRWALFAVDERWTAIVTNARDGSDFADDESLVAGLCDARVCRVVDREGGWRTVGEFHVRAGYPARIFELYTPERGPFAPPARSIHAMLDGDRWSFAALGDEPLPIEATFDYDARLKRDRFTSANLRALLLSLGVESSVPEAFAAADEFFLVDVKLRSRRWRKRAEAAACTPAQADDPGYAYLQRGLGWVSSMRTHADSVVWDLTRAVLLNPALRGDAQRHLDAARRRLGTEAFEREARAAEADLRTRGG